MGVSILEGSKIGRIATAVENIAAGITKSYYTLTVTALTRDNVDVTGQVVYVRQGGADGPIYASAAYEGQPVSFSLPSGFVYHVSITNNIAHHFAPTTAAGIVSNTNISHILYYEDLSNITSAQAIKDALNANDDLTGLVGESITCSWRGTTLTWDVADYDKLEGVITLLLHDTLPDQMQFEPQQALAYFEYGLPAGDYSFQNGNTTYYFTLTTAIPAGGQLRATTSAFYTYQSQSVTETLEVGTVSTTAISGATALGKCATSDGAYPLNHMDRVNSGSNNFAESGLLEWLNSDTAANTPLARINKFSRPYIVNTPGFLSGLDADFLAVLDNTAWKCSPNTTYEAPASMGGVAQVGHPYTVTKKFGLASEKEIFGTYTCLDVGDAIFDLYEGAEATDRIKRYGTGARYWWLRTSYTIANYERYVYSNGTVYHNYAYNAAGVVPACKISKSS